MASSESSESSSSESLTPEEKKRIKNRYRFGGYILNPKIEEGEHPYAIKTHLITLDETGPSYIFLRPYEYTHGQPLIWSEKAVSYGIIGKTGIIGKIKNGLK